MDSETLDMPEPPRPLPKLRATFAQIDTLLITNHHAVGVEVPPWTVSVNGANRITVPNRSSATFVSKPSLMDDALATLDGKPHLELTEGTITENPSIGTPWKGNPFVQTFEYTPEDVAASPVSSDESWKRNYSSSYTGLVVDSPSGPKAITFNHSENYSMVVLNTISHRTPDVPGKITAYYRSTFYPTTPVKMANLYGHSYFCLLYTSPSPRDATLSRMPSSA